MITLNNGSFLIYRRYTFDRSDSGFGPPKRNIIIYASTTEEYIRRARCAIEKCLEREVYTEQIKMVPFKDFIEIT